MTLKWTRECGSGSHQPPFPAWWDNLSSTVQKTFIQQHHLCCSGYSHHSGTELLSAHGPSSSRCSSLFWFNILLAVDWRWRHNPFISHYITPLWLLSDKGTHVRFFWIPSHCGFDGNEWVDELARDPWHDINPLVGVHYADFKPLVNFYIQQLVQIRWDVAVHGRDLYLLKPTLGPPQKLQHLTRAEEVVIIRLILSHIKPPSLLSCPEDRQLLVIIVVRCWPLTICSWSVQCPRKVVTNTTQLTHWILSLREFPRTA